MITSTHFRSFVTFAAGVAVAIGIPAAIAQVSHSGYFSDVGSSSYFFEAINEMSRLGIINGYGNGRFGPNDTVTRGQVAVMLSRYDHTVIDPLRAQIAALDAKVGLTTNAGQCKPYQCADGVSIPSCTTDGHVINYFADPCLTHQSSSAPAGSCGDKICQKNEVAISCIPKGVIDRSCDGKVFCPSDCSQEQVSCDVYKKRFDVIASSSARCATDSDCVLFQSGCPFVTCGVAVNANQKNIVQSAASAYISCTEQNAPTACAKCATSRVSCVQNRCVTSL